MKDQIATVTHNAEIAQNIYAITFSLPEGAESMHGGQFVNLATGNPAQLLRRPLGITKVEGKEVTVCYQVKGAGTRQLTGAKEGDRLRVLLPLGNWFDLDDFQSVAVIGGGVGIFPLVATIREHAGEKDFYSYIGFRNKQAVCLLDELEKSKALTVSTDDGSFGRKGNAVESFMDDVDRLHVDAIIACGPPIMLRVLKQKLEEKGITVPCFVSLEERMGCGVGACLVCVCKGADGENLRVCRDGPVFDIKEVDL